MLKLFNKMAGPGITQAGKEINVPVTSTDFYPTLLEMADLSLIPDQHKDGKSLVPLLKKGKTPDREAIFWHYPHYSNQGAKPGGAVRKNNYKLIENYEDGSLELYNLEKDIEEANNLVEENPDKVEDLKKLLDDWKHQVDAKGMVVNPSYQAY